VYHAAGGPYQPLSAVAASFGTMDCVVHQLLTEVMAAAVQGRRPNPAPWGWMTLAWVGFGIPVMIQKVRRLPFETQLLGFIHRTLTHDRPTQIKFASALHELMSVHHQTCDTSHDDGAPRRNPLLKKAFDRFIDVFEKACHEGKIDAATLNVLKQLQQPHESITDVFLRVLVHERALLGDVLEALYDLRSHPTEENERALYERGRLALLDLGADEDSLSLPTTSTSSLGFYFNPQQLMLLDITKLIFLFLMLYHFAVWGNERSTV
jgi:hypothetical protein